MVSLAITDVEVKYCKCKPPAVSLIEMGCFSSTPKRAPTWAFDLSLLEQASLQFLYSATSISAWCNATCDFLAGRRVNDVPTPVSPAN